ncbi:MAG: outer membrane beta-barrel protein [Candidatus Schekmanbacteria bacterium]|nr:outer membrane beta-barrel protein [Candidatus Schekmanbacteria bacterium]
MSIAFFSRPGLLACLLAAICAPPAGAAESKLGLHFGARSGYYEPTNSERSYEAVYGAGSLLHGVDVGWTHRSGFSAEGTFWYFRKDGEGVRLVAGELVKSGRAKRLIITPVLFSVTYRFLRERRVAPYIGAGIGWWRVQEKDVESGEAGTETSWGAHLVSGLSVRVHHLVSLLGELGYAVVPDSLGANERSTAHFYGEDDIGGVSVSVRLAFTP